MKKKVALILALTLALTSLISFGALADDPIVLRFSWWGGDARHAATLEVIKQFEALHPNVKIEAEYGSSDGYHDKLSTQLASSTAPDIIQIDPETLPTYVAAETQYFLDFNEQGFDFSKFEESYLRQRINGCYDGKQFGIPSGVAGAALVVNKAAAEQYGIDLTQELSWEDMITYGKAVHEASPDNYFMAANISTLTNMVFLSYAKQVCGDSLFNTETKELNITQEQMQQVFEYIKALYDNNVIPPYAAMASYEGDNLQTDPNWIGGKYVSAFAYVSTFAVLADANPTAEHYAGKLPVLADAKNGGWAANCPQVFAVSSTSKHPAEAVAFLDYFFNNETAMRTLGTVRSVPPTQAARDLCSAEGLLTPVLAEAGNIAAAYGGTVNDKLISTKEAKQIIYDAVEQIAYGTVTPEQAAADTINYLLAYAAEQ